MQYGRAVLAGGYVTEPIVSLRHAREHDVRRPPTPTGTDLLGLVKHLTGCEVSHFGHVFARRAGLD